jgi:polyisoprenyl-phosphate glycosyltransferase
MRNPGISLIVPAFNEEGAIAETLEAAKRVAGTIGEPIEILVVDDGSSDRTASLAEASGVRVIRHPMNCGYGRSLLTGIDAATHDLVAIADADGTYPFEQFPALLEFYRKGFDMAVGARRGEHFHGSLGKRLLRAIFRMLAEYTCGRNIPDINSGFRIFKRGPVLARRSSLATGFSFTTTITLLFMLNNYLVGYFPVDYKKRVGNSKVRLLRDSFRSTQIIITAIAQFNPLKLYLLLFIAAVTGNLCVAAAGASLGPGALLIYLIMWNTLCLIGACAIIALGGLRSSGREERRLSDS